ncbi:MAG: uracil-DNA glycosylase [Alphaproteobacteria bacterium]|nr:uracil-DNA glycosylase [Alphaproteobacteria bacterium]MCB9974387.1 uracil-DNA glycosylase [Rhodospirillales bacterium]
MTAAQKTAFIEALRWYQEQGVTDALADAPQDATAWLNTPIGAPARSTLPAKNTGSPAPTLTPAVSHENQQPAFLGVAEARAEAVRLAAAAQTLEDLKSALENFEGFSIKKTATNLVFADGDPSADIMLVGEAPGADEDRLGRPFVGISGQLLDKILKTIGLDRHAQEHEARIYISNILNWRPPGNRNPAPAEIELALPFIERHIQIAAPKLLLFCGGVSAKALLNAEQGISRLRGRWHPYTPRTSELAGLSSGPIPALAVYHPSYLLRTPAQKKHAWSDMLEIQRKIKGL